MTKDLETYDLERAWTQQETRRVDALRRRLRRRLFWRRHRGRLLSIAVLALCVAGVAFGILISKF